MAQHKEKAYPNSFSAKYNCVKLVYYKWFDTIIEAIAEEKRKKPSSTVSILNGKIYTSKQGSGKVVLMVNPDSIVISIKKIIRSFYFTDHSVIA